MKPGVQMPHCSAAPSRNAFCTGCNPSAGATPSMVVTLRPSTSAPITRHELTSRPSSTTLHAPQLPLLQPSFAPVSRSSSRSTSSKLCRGSQRNSVSRPLTVVRTWIFLDTNSAPLRALDGAVQGPLDQDADQVPAVLRVAAHVADRLRRRLGRGRRLGDLRLTQLAADEGRPRVGYQKRCRG